MRALHRIRTPELSKPKLTENQISLIKYSILRYGQAVVGQYRTGGRNYTRIYAQSGNYPWYPMTANYYVRRDTRNIEHIDWTKVSFRRDYGY